MDRYGDGALVKLYSKTDPVSSSYLQGLLQHDGRLLPVRVLAEGADTDVLVQADVVPEGNCSYSSCRCSLDLGNDYLSICCATKLVISKQNTNEIFSF